eukprot:TRINITY_DN7847_c0_g1_i2.p1 TRINITY_DN7847_c0_g1~~TRINITY_DN7847_c0_g1_i2.p1  ORF type:complete len:221 (+),score=57.49 TRINITY_DN7847_c0_g1_i2:95-757(+)
MSSKNFISRITETEKCPLCFNDFSLVQLVSHVEHCNGTDQNSSDEQNQAEKEGVADPHHDADYEFALQLQREMDEAEGIGMAKCQLCDKKVKVENIYILDECGDKFCKECLSRYVREVLSTSVAIKCPIKGCGKVMSVRDVEDFIPTKSEIASFNPEKSSKMATERIMSELKHILAAEPEKNGYSVEPIDDNMYKWEILIFGFDEKSPLAQDMKARNIEH